MTAWRLTVWTRFDATPEEVWRVKTDVAVLRDEFAPLLRVSGDDPAGLQRALRETGTGTFGLRMTGPFGVLGWTWPVEVRESHAPHRYRDTSTNPAFSAWNHAHRIEPQPSGDTRYVDDVVFTPRLRPSRLAAEFMRVMFVHRHQRAARHLPVHGEWIGRAWLRRADARVPVDTTG